MALVESLSVETLAVLGKIDFIVCQNFRGFLWLSVKSDWWYSLFALRISVVQQFRKFSFQCSSDFVLQNFLKILSRRFINSFDFMIEPRAERAFHPFCYCWCVMIKTFDKNVSHDHALLTSFIKYNGSIILSDK